MQKGSLRTANKASLKRKQALLATQKHLNCNANKPSLQCNQGLFGDKSPFAPPQNARFHDFMPRQDLWNGTSRCQIILLHTYYICIYEGGRASRPTTSSDEYIRGKRWAGLQCSLVVAVGRDARPPACNTKRVYVFACGGLAVTVGRDARPSINTPSTKKRFILIKSLGKKTPICKHF